MMELKMEDDEMI